MLVCCLPIRSSVAGLILRLVTAPDCDVLCLVAGRHQVSFPAQRRCLLLEAKILCFKQPVVVSAHGFSYAATNGKLTTGRSRWAGKGLRRTTRLKNNPACTRLKTHAPSSWSVPEEEKRAQRGRGGGWAERDMNRNPLAVCSMSSCPKEHDPGLVLATDVRVNPCKTWCKQSAALWSDRLSFRNRVAPHGFLAISHRPPIAQHVELALEKARRGANPCGTGTPHHIQFCHKPSRMPDEEEKPSVREPAYAVAAIVQPCT